ncbi:3-methyl-2-oxobutanoate hydroxymethyltransferase [Monosporozyma servazzii]
MNSMNCTRNILFNSYLLRSNAWNGMVVARCYSSQGLKKLPAQYTIHDIKKKYSQGIPLSMVTAYDYITASWVNQARCDLLLVGDSLAMTSLGYTSTTELPFDEFKYHVKSVCRNQDGPSLVVSDMPFGSFEASIPLGISNAIELMKLSPRLTSLKVEVGPLAQDEYTMEFVKQLCSRGIPVMGHIGLTPQRANSLGGFKVQGNKDPMDAVELYKTAKKLQEIGCWSIVIEAMPHKVAAYITQNLSIPVIGIGAGNGTSGQVLVLSDMLGLQPTDHLPKFVNKYHSILDEVRPSLEQYKNDVESYKFPETGLHTFNIKDEIYDEFVQIIERNNL